MQVDWGSPRRMKGLGVLCRAHFFPGRQWLNRLFMARFSYVFLHVAPSGELKAVRAPAVC